MVNVMSITCIYSFIFVRYKATLCRDAVVAECFLIVNVHYKCLCLLGWVTNKGRDAKQIWPFCQ